MRTALTALAKISVAFTLLIADSFVGTWRLNVAKSTLKGPSGEIASETMTISETGSTIRNIVDIVLKSGEKRHEEHTSTLDGKEHPAAGVGFKQEGATEIDLRADSSTYRITRKRDGKVIEVITSTVSHGGKVMTSHRTGSAGEEILVFDKR